MSDWHDPLADDEEARAREARRAEREQRRREEATRESLGERVRAGLEEEPAPASSPGEARPVQGPAQAGTPPEGPRAEDHPVQPSSPAQEPPTAVQPLPLADAPPDSAGPTQRRPASAAVHRRRMLALAGVGVLIVIVAVLGTVISRGGDGEDSNEPALPAGKKTIEVVVPEGYDRTQIAEVAKENDLKGDYLEATESFKGFDLAKYGAEDAQSLEGFLFPATYELFKGAKVEDLVAKQLEAFEANAAEIDLEAAAEDLGYSPYDLVNVAAMVEREIAVPEERELASSVIYNRLDEGTPLGIDATIRFEDQDYDGQIVQSRLEQDTPYNTRINSGLPPGPIGNPGVASLEAAANPADSDFFYFVVKPGSCNEHTFVETEAEFAAAEQAYQDALIAEGGSPTDC